MYLILGYSCKLKIPTVKVIYQGIKLACHQTTKQSQMKEAGYMYRQLVSKFIRLSPQQMKK